MRHIPFAASLWSLLLQSVFAQNVAGRLEISVINLRSESGVVLINVDTEASWFRSAARAARSLQVAPNGRAAYVSIEDLPAGRYAVRVHHDENGDGRFNTGLFGLPTERYGFTGRSSRLGPPAFAEAAFQFTAPMSLTIHLK
jgi:uncharacterized protein (DUF2141 family)